MKRSGLFSLFIFTVILLHIIILISTQFIDWPEMLLYPWLIHNGFKLYVDLLIPYQPFALILLRLFFILVGFSPESLRLIHLIMIIGIDLLLTIILIKIYKSKLITILGLLLYILWQSSSEGNGLWFDHFLLIPLLFSYYFIRKALNKGSSELNIIFGGLFTSILLITKQTAYYFIFGLFFYSFINYLLYKKKFQTIVILKIILLAQILPVLQACYYYLKGNINQYLYWTYKFPLSLRNDQNYIIKPNLLGDYPLILFSLLVLIVYFYQLIIKKSQFLHLFSIFCFFSFSLFMFPRWNLTHAQPLIMLLIFLFSEIMLVVLINKWKWVNLLLFLLPVLLLTLKENNTYIKRNINKSYRFYNSDLKDNIKNIVAIKKSDSYYLFGNTESYYVYLKEPPLIKPYIQLFPWNTAVVGIQENQIFELNKLNINYIFYLPYHIDNVYYNGGKPIILFNYVSQNYTVISKDGDIVIYKKNN